ncbi:hypothetical protein [Methylosinus sp. PW1]|uniref:hypothetical protein n=1 Tax=Methylosinus sp. PW1 TaxID=107636 RepID=UPI00055A8D27|nr:hypothetical protein [Methylosinus sp. PW1]
MDDLAMLEKACGDVTVESAPEAATFVRAGPVLFGARWKAPMARALGVTRETVSRWVSAGDVPPWAMNVVRLMNANKGAVLSLCDRTGNMAKPWADAGFECFCVDLQHPAGEHARDGSASQNSRGLGVYGFSAAIDGL